MLANIGGHGLREVIAAVVHGQNDAFQSEARIKHPADTVNGLSDLRDALKGVELCLQGDQHRVGGDEGIQCQQAQGWRTIQNDEGRSGGIAQRQPQAVLALLKVHQFQLSACQIRVGRHDGKVRDPGRAGDLIDWLALGQQRIAPWPSAPPIYSHTRRSVALRIEVNQQNRVTRG